MALTVKELREFLDLKAGQYNTTGFIESDPVSVPHLFSKREDIEIAAFLAAVLSWGNRKSIIANARRLVCMMDNDPHRFILGATNSDLAPFGKFRHRTFNGEDCIFFLEALQRVYRRYGSLESLFHPGDDGMKEAIGRFRDAFFHGPHPLRTEKHVSDPRKGSAAKRINMFLRWMVRQDSGGVDFGLWKSISPSQLICPLDVHVGNTARKLGLLKRKANDWKAAEELTRRLRKFDPADPVRYDFALFGLGINEKF